MPGIAIKPLVVTELQRQINQELGAAHSYLALGVWCDAQNLKGFARYFSTQAAEEREHAQKFIRHLLDRGVSPAPTALPAPKSNFSDLLEVARHAQAMERENTVGINACYSAALAQQDYPAQVAAAMVHRGTGRGGKLGRRNGRSRSAGELPAHKATSTGTSSGTSAKRASTPPSAKNPDRRVPRRRGIAGGVNSLR